MLEDNYKGLVGWLQVSGHRVVHDWAARYRGKLVVDIGCGSGQHLIHSREHYDKYYGLDNDLSLLSVMRGALPRVPVVGGSAYALPFRDESIDCIVSLYCLEHLQELQACCLELRRVMKPDGGLLIGLPAEGGWMMR